MGDSKLQRPPHAPGWKSRTTALFVTITVLQLSLYQRSLRWLVSGSPCLTLVLLLGEVRGNRVLPFVHLWTLFTTLNLFYAVASTSWLFFWVFTVLCYPAIFLACLFQFKVVGTVTRRILRGCLRQWHFVDDKIAFFEVPALEIDTEVTGLMVLRGLTFTLSTLTLVVHGVEVGIRLSDDLTLAIQTEQVTVSFLRGIHVADCFVNLKSAKYNFSVYGKSPPTDPGRSTDPETPLHLRPRSATVKTQMTDGNPPSDSSTGHALMGMRQYTLSNELAMKKYRQMLEMLDDRNEIRQAREYVESFFPRSGSVTPTDAQQEGRAIRAQICSRLHDSQPIPNPSKRSIKVTTLQQLLPGPIRRFVHRLPMLLRLLLNPLSYFHPVNITSITATVPGPFTEKLATEKMIKLGEDMDEEVGNLRDRVSSWLSSAIFTVQLGEMTGNALVPFLPGYNIRCLLAAEGVFAYRTMLNEERPTQIVSLSGTDASFTVPGFMLPHHEHLLPAVPGPSGHDTSTNGVEELQHGTAAKGAAADSSNASKDEAVVKMSIRARLPAVFDQELIDAITLLAKLGKLVDLENSPDPIQAEFSRINDLRETVNSRVKEKFTKAININDQWLSRRGGKSVEIEHEHEHGTRPIRDDKNTNNNNNSNNNDNQHKAPGTNSEPRHSVSDFRDTMNSKVKEKFTKIVIANDQWLARQVGKLMRKLEQVNGDLGYTGDIPVPLEEYRATGWLEKEGSKILP